MSATPPPRPRPEDFLELVQRSKRGHLKLYIGFAAGVGKTYRMLEEARALRKRGVDVVLGYVETHGRPETEALVAGVEVVPRRKVEYRGVVVEEMDLDAVLARRPEIAIVDEIPHTNVPGSRHRRRWEDVAELLDAGINVIGAMNIQHVESLKDVVERATGVSIRETVPDAFLRGADQVVNLDLAVEDLQERLRAGKIYAPEKVTAALSNFFREENLGTLRELALREVAESLGRAGEERREKTPDERGGATLGRVLVCIASRSPRAEALLRRASRIAGRLATDWFAVYVETPGESPTTIDSEAQRHLLANIQLAKDLGAEVVRLKGRDAAATILDFARSHGVGHIVIGRSHRPWWRRFLGRTVPQRLVEEAEEFDVQVVAAPEPGDAPVSLRAKLILAQLPLLAALVVLALTASLTTTSLGRGAGRILNENYRSVLAAQRMKESVERMDSGALFTVAGNRDQGALLVEEHRRRFAEELHVEETNITEPNEAEQAAALRARWIDYDRAVSAFLASADDPAALRTAYFAELEPRFRAVKDAADAVLTMNQDAMRMKSDAAERAAARFDTLVVAVAGIALVLGAVVSAAMTSRILRPLSVLRQTAQRIGEGDLAVRARVVGGDEIAGLAATFNTMAERLEAYRKSSLGELLEAQQAMQAAIDSLPDPVLVLGLDDALLGVNEAAERLLGIGADMSGPAALAALPPTVRDVVDAVRRHVLGGRGAYVPRGLEEAVRAPTRQGEIHFLARAMPVRSMEGAVVATTVVLQDVSRLVRFDERRNDLVATVAHELRTPLTSMRMAIHLCLDGTVGALAEKQADLLYAAREDCERLQTTVDELLDVSRIQAGRAGIRAEPVAAEDLVRDVIAAHGRAAADAGVRLVAEVMPDTGAVLVDRERAVHALGNLVANAVRFGPAGSDVVVRAASAPGVVRFEVRDAGPGIPPEFRDAIFERSVQVPGSRGGGAGLGLFIARENVQAHGGRIGVESEVGRGSTFWIELPAAPG